MSYVKHLLDGILLIFLTCLHFDFYRSTGRVFNNELIHDLRAILPDFLTLDHGGYVYEAKKKKSPSSQISNCHTMNVLFSSWLYHYTINLEWANTDFIL